ncbi:MAG: DUF21 domain-containing protein [Verrucomicrobia bacterium]|nr:DUF21 domain-containing protein [Verrucomicrobiota bacterium]MCH8512786.1 CNNM domain-containing protein [Kiritimatiellia bacterium]
MNPLTEALLLVVFLMGSGFYSGIETGIVSVNRVRLRHLVKRKSKRAIHLQEFIENPDRMLANTLVGTNLCNTALTVAGSTLVVRLIGDPRVGNVVAGVVLTLLILVFGEYLPKAWFQSHPYSRSAKFVGILRMSAWLFQGISLPVTWLVKRLIPDPPPEKEGIDQNHITRRDIQFLLSRESGATPDIGEQRRRMIVGVFALSEKTAKDVMVPRSQMMLVKQDAPMEEIMELASKTTVKSFPVYSDTEQRFTGLLKLSDLFTHVEGPFPRLQELTRPPQYVAEDTAADDLLPRLRLSRQPMLLVRDDQDMVIGFVTTEVVLEEIVGPLYEG